MASEYYKWLARDVKPREEKVLTPAEKRRNWWYYYKYHVLIGAVLLSIGVSLICSYLGIGQTKPDYSIAYVGTVFLSDEAEDTLRSRFARLGRDENGDGQVFVAVNQYVSHSTGDSDSLYYAQAAAAQLIADITDCDSYFFLLADPEGFQKEMHLLCGLDGTLPADSDFSAEGKTARLDSIPALSDLPEELLSLHLGRRGFWTDATTDHIEGCALLWEHLWTE